MCWLVDPWASSRERYLRAWRDMGWPVVLWHGGQISSPPVEGIELRDSREIIEGSPIEEAFAYEVHHKNHAPAADLFRYEVLYQRGGAYCDIDILPRKIAVPSLWDTRREVAFDREWLRLTYSLEIRFILTPGAVSHHPLIGQIRDRAVARCQDFRDKGGYANGYDDPYEVVGRTGPQMVKALVIEHCLERGLRGPSAYRKLFLTRATDVATVENAKEHYVKKLPEVLRIAALPQTETGNT
jgi:hypothetical protein